MAHEGSPTYEIRQGVHGFDFPDGTRVDVHQPQRDRVGRLWAEVTARVGARVLNRARVDLLDLQARERFHRATVGLDEGVDWQARLLYALEHVVRTLEDAEADTAAEEPPAPLTDAVEPFPVEVFPTPLARFVQEAASALPCPPDFIGVLMLPLLGAAIGTARVLEVKPNWHEGPRIYAAVVAEPGSKKSPALDLVMTPFRHHQRLLHTTYLTNKERYHRALDQYEDELTDWKQRRGTGRAALRQKPQPPLEPVLPQVFTTDATLEALVAVLERNPRGLACIRDELTGWVLAMNQYKGGKGADRQAWLSFWNGTPLLVNRKTRKDPMVLENPLVCVASCLPPDVLADLADERGREDGFLHRILFSFPDRQLVRWTDAAVSDAVLESYRRVYDGLWALAGISPQDPRVVGWTASGRQHFIAFANARYAELADAEFPETLRGPFAKFEGYGARLALLLQLCRVVCGEAGAEAVDEVSVCGAAALVHYFESHVRRVYARLQATPEDQHVAQALAWIARQGGQVTARAVLRHHVAGVKTTSDAIHLLQTLEDRGHGTVEEGSRRSFRYIHIST